MFYHAKIHKNKKPIGVDEPSTYGEETVAITLSSVADKASRAAFLFMGFSTSGV
jgi:hypothetical protein